MYMNDDSQYTGLDLRLMRTAAQVRAVELASVMGVGSSRIAYIEKRSTVTVRAAQRYLAALGELITKPTEKDAA